MAEAVTDARCTCGEAWAGHPNPHALTCLLAQPTAPGARQSDELREALTEALAERLHPRNGMSERAVVRLADALLPVVTAWAERQARARAAEELFVLASRLVAQDVNDMAVYDEIRALRDGLTATLAANDRTDPA